MEEIAVVDTNFVIAVIFEDHIFHKLAIKDWEKLRKAYLPIIAISELAYFLIKNGFSLNDVIDNVLSDPKIEVVENTLEDIYFAIRNSPKSYDDFNDYMIISLARRLKLKILTYDHKMKKKGSRLNG
ncbi:PIN domain-containing protein [Sulfurisphaera tokodaii]|uniref:Toxin n=1 Tax=Sulfurisphaera tokodaii (strain DSM 16993 / JCM 10545 / NBRC 100140 / 7) TaxID=273063 RepID=F9VNB3_SULTO|nr:PIN domain-containing protein [Sulfurisphaera tokodaii]BAK54410.1 putative toxin [Sulfurisphaera tokodaii str. 7]